MSLLNFIPGLGDNARPNTGQYLDPKYSDLSNFGPNPNTSSLKSMLSSMPQFSPVTKEDISKQYDPIRERINSQYSQIQSQGQDAIDRQFAAMGGGPGNGAKIKQTENLASEIAKQKGADLEGVNAQEAQAGLGAKEYNNQMQTEQNQFLFGANSSLANLDLAYQQAQAEAANNAFNKEISQFQATHSGGLLGGGGFLGTGTFAGGGI